MRRFVCIAVGLALLFLQGAAASRYCACMEDMAKPSCCQKQMPCCSGGECKMHPEAMPASPLAVDLIISIDAATLIPSFSLQLLFAKVDYIAGVPEPHEVRIRCPDVGYHALRAPPLSA